MRYPHINSETDEYFQRLNEALLEVKTIRDDIKSLKTKPDTVNVTKTPTCPTITVDLASEASKETAESAESSPANHLPQLTAEDLLKPKPQRTQKKKKGTLRCRTCTECKAWCETSSRDASEWCYPCLYRKREGKSNKSGCKLRGPCINPKIADSDKGVPAEEDVETDDNPDETFFDVDDFYTGNPPENNENSGGKPPENSKSYGPKRKEMDGTPPEKSLSQRPKEDEDLEEGEEENLSSEIQTDLV